MSFFLSVGLVIAAAVMVIIAAVQASPTLFMAAAVASGLAVVLLWRRASAEKDHALLADVPPRSQPNWDRNIRESQAPPPDDDSQSTIGIADDRALGIGQYDDLVAAEIMPSLETLSEEQLRAVLRHEQAGLARTSIIDRARRLIDLTSGIEVDRTSTPSTGMPGTGPGRSRRQDRNELKKDTGLSL